MTLSRGDCVRLRFSSSHSNHAELNGCLATLEHYVEHRQRWAVTVNGTGVLVTVANMDPCHKAPPSPPPGSKPLDAHTPPQVLSKSRSMTPTTLMVNTHSLARQHSSSPLFSRMPADKEHFVAATTNPLACLVEALHVDKCFGL